MEISAPLVTAAGDVTERDTRDHLVTNTRHLHVAPDTQARNFSLLFVSPRSLGGKDGRGVSWGGAGLLAGRMQD